MTDQNIVDAADIQLVVNGFKQYLKRAIDTRSFKIESLKKFMEPIFERAGYRYPTHTQGAFEKSRQHLDIARIHCR